MAHIHLKHYAETIFTKQYVRWTKNFSWLCVIYGGMCEHGSVVHSRSQGSNPMEMFQQVADKDRTVLSICY